MSIGKRQLQYVAGTYTPKKTKRHWKRDKHEDLLKKFQFEITKTPFNAPLNYLSDYELLVSINNCLATIGLITMTDEELNRELSLKN